nr:hypothetical protein [Tanacetum cinerariifolium]
MWSDEEKRIQKINRLVRSLLIQGLSNDIYSLIDSKKIAKDLWDSLARHMLGSEYGEQDRKATVLYEYNTFKATEGELLLDTYIKYLQVINDLKKYGYSKDNCELNFKLLNNLQPEWKHKEKVVISLDSEGSEADDFIQLKNITDLLAKAFNRKKFYSKPTNNNLRTSSTSHSANKKQEFVKTDNKKVEKKDDEKNQIKDYEYYKTNMLLAKKDKDEQVLLAEDQTWMESSSDSDQEKNANMVFMAQIEKVLSESEASSSSADEKISEINSFKIANKAKTKAIPVEESTGVLESMFGEGDMATYVFSDFVICACVLAISMSRSSCDSKNVEIKLKRKRRKRKSSKQNVKQVDNDVSRANSDFVHFLDLDTFSSVRRPKNSGVIWKKKWSSNTSKVDLSAVSISKLNKNVKRYSRKELLACNNSRLGETSSASVCNDAMNVFCNSRMCDLLDDNNFFIFDDESVKISPVSKMPFRKKPCDSMNVRSKSNSNKSLPRTVEKWLPKLQPLAEPVAKWFPRIVQICLWIIDSGCSKHMT